MQMLKYAGTALAALVALVALWQFSKEIPIDADWKDTLSQLSTAEFDGDMVTVRNVRNFQYNEHYKPSVQSWEDRTYDLRELKRIWFVVDPFNKESVFAHTFVSFEFEDGSFLAISIEGRLTKDQNYEKLDGFLHTYPLIYIAADERDVIYVRAHVAQHDVFTYPIKATPAQARLLLVDMLERMNDLAVHPEWYNGVFANCTSSIADHVNKIWPGLLPRFDWQSLLTNYAGKLLYNKGLIDTQRRWDEARAHFNVKPAIDRIGYTPDFSRLIREAK